MRKSIEMRKQLDSLKNEIQALMNEGKTSEAHAKLGELAEIKNAITVQEALEESEITAGPNPQNSRSTRKVDTEREVIENRIFNKRLLGKNLSEEENEYIKNQAGSPGQVGATDAKGGYLLRKEQTDRLLEYRRGLVVLKDECDVISVNTRSGNIPVVLDNTAELINFEELNDINKSDIDFGNISYNVGDYGDIIPVSNTLLADTDIDLVDVIGRRFVRKAVRTENTKILAALKTLSPKPATGYADIKTVFNVTLDPALVEGSVVITNQSGFDFLDKVKLDNGLPLLQPDITEPSRKVFGGHRVVVISDAVLANSGTKIPYFVGNMVEFIKFFDRQQVAVAVSTEAGFTKNATLLRAIERFDVQKADAEAMVYLQLTPPVGP